MPPRTLSPEELESVRSTELAQDRRPPAVKAAATSLKPADGMVKLYHPRYSNLKYGDASRTAVGDSSDRLIVFGTVEPNVAIVREDHPLLPGLMRKHPGVVMLRPGEEPGKVYTCELCDIELPSKRALAAHRKEVHEPPSDTKQATSAEA